MLKISQRKEVSRSTIVERASWLNDFAWRRAFVRGSNAMLNL